MALAAVRETFEEAGLAHRRAASAARLRQSRRRGRLSSRTAIRPALARLTLLRARHHAARPAAPLRHALLLRARRGHRPQSRRCQTASCPTSNGIPSPRRARLELPNITRVVLEDLGERIAAGALHASDVPVPFYHRRNGSFRRDLISAERQSLTNAVCRDRVRASLRSQRSLQRAGTVMAKPITQKIKLLSTAGTGFFYVTKKNPRTATDKLSLQEVRSRRAQARRLQGNQDQVALAARPCVCAYVGSRQSQRCRSLCQRCRSAALLSWHAPQSRPSQRRLRLAGRMWPRP